jgi:hypothetical protein
MIFKILPKTNSNICFSILVLLFACVHCKKSSSDARQPNQVIIESLELPSFTTAAVKGSVKNFTSPVTEKGICWGKAVNPTIQDNKIADLSASESFSVTLNNLSAFTQYNLRAYAITSSGITYSENKTVTTTGLTVSFDKEYKTPSGAPDIVQVIGNEASAFIILSKIVRESGSGSYSRLTKIDASGTEIWRRDLDDGSWKEPEFIEKVSDGYIIGTTYFQLGDIRIVLLKTDLSGNLLWQKEFKKFAYNSFIRFTQQSTAIYTLTIKSVTTNNSDGPSRKVYLCDFTVDENGNTSIGAEYPDFSAVSTTNLNFNWLRTADNGYLGYANQYTNNTGDHNIKAIKFGAANNSIQWQMLYDEPATEFVTKAIETSSLNYVFAGTKDSLIPPNITKGKAWFFGVDKNNGRIQWQTQYRSNALGDYTSAWPLDVFQHSTGLYSAGIVSEYRTRWSTQPFILKLDHSGTLLWDYVIPAKSGYAFSRASAVYVSPNKDIYIFGLRNDKLSNLGFMYMMKLAE